MMSMYNQYKEVLEHGYVDLIEQRGDDVSVALEASKRYYEPFDTDGLIRRLADNCNYEPFKRVSVSFEISMPIFVSMQWAKHRKIFLHRKIGFDVFNRQFYIPNNNSEILLNQISENNDAAFDTYKKMLFDRHNKREDAESVLPTSIYTTMVVQANLLEWIKFLNVRIGRSTLLIERYAQVVSEMLRFVCPRSTQALIGSQL